jgi:hypothetical protein
LELLAAPAQVGKAIMAALPAVREALAVAAVRALLEALALALRREPAARARQIQLAEHRLLMPAAAVVREILFPRLAARVAVARVALLVLQTGYLELQIPEVVAAAGLLQRLGRAARAVPAL